MQRRAVIALLGLAPLALHGQQKKVYRVGVLETTPLRANAENFERFRKGMEERGYVEGPSLVSPTARPTGARSDSRRSRATSSIPIVMAAVADPVESGLASSLALPAATSPGSPAPPPSSCPSASIC